MEQFMKSRSSLLNLQLHRDTKNTLKIVLLLLLLNDAFGVETYKIKEVSVKEGEDVALRTGETEIQREDDIQWMFGDEGDVIAEFNIMIKFFETYDGDDGRFGDRLELDRQTGSLIIRDSRTTDSGVYTVQIVNKGAAIYKKFYVTVSDSKCCDWSARTPPSILWQRNPLVWDRATVSTFLLAGVIGFGLLLFVVWSAS
uniref:Immunoglobulin V-set domain-containing protein n=1 Tax=Cyprinus carpio carpio TaxID=630221 RepID=A0A9J8C7Q6_CYPCA